MKIHRKIDCATKRLFIALRRLDPTRFVVSLENQLFLCQLSFRIGQFQLSDPGRDANASIRGRDCRHVCGNSTCAVISSRGAAGTCSLTVPIGIILLFHRGRGFLHPAFADFIIDDNALYHW